MKKGQVTIFVIIGIVIILVIGVIYYVNSRAKVNINFSKDPLEDILRFQIGSCIGLIAEKRMNDAMSKSGYMLEGMPDNVVSFGAYDYVVAYDKEFPYYSLTTEQDLVVALQADIESQLPDCIATIADEISQRTEDYQINLAENPVLVKTTDKGISIDYEYEIVVNNDSRAFKENKDLVHNLVYFLRYAQDLTNTYLDTINDQDDDANMKICQQLRDNMNIVPRYSTLFFRVVAGNDDISLTVGEEFFIVTLVKDKDVFAFAIKPQIEDVCTAKY